MIADFLRMRARFDVPAPAPLMAVAGFLVNYGGFGMERKKMQGLKDRAEGRSEAPMPRRAGR